MKDVFDLNNLVRNNIKQLVPYSSARDEFKGNATVFLDANENSLGSPNLKWYNRYPDPYQIKIKNKLANIKKIPPEQIFIGNGSDECIDLIYRCFCEPNMDNVIICPPTYGMYSVSANINAINIIEAPLLPNFQLDIPLIESLVNEHTKIIWLCSPNNPTGNSIQILDIEFILNNFNGIVVIDEAYINFSKQKSCTLFLNEYANLIILQTLSKAWGLAGLRLGIAFAQESIIHFLNKIKPPYNINEATQEIVYKCLDNVDDVNNMINHIVDMRNALIEIIKHFTFVENIYPSDANFILIKCTNATELYQYLLNNGIVIRNRSNVQLCYNCVRITIGTEKENTILIDALINYNEKN